MVLSDHCLASLDGIFHPWGLMPGCLRSSVSGRPGASSRPNRGMAPWALSSSEDVH
jgi:hypothetical protein